MFKIKKYIPDIVVAIILIAGIGLLAYPTIGDYINALHSSKAIGSYVEKTKDLSKEEKENLLREAREYNESLVGKVNRYYLNEEEKKRYAHILDITKTGIMAYVEIPKLNIYMPVYHTDDDGDGFTDIEEEEKGTDPKDPNSVPQVDPKPVKPDQKQDPEISQNKVVNNVVNNSYKKPISNAPKTGDFGNGTGYTGLAALAAGLMLLLGIKKKRKEEDGEE